MTSTTCSLLTKSLLLVPVLAAAGCLTEPTETTMLAEELPLAELTAGLELRYAEETPTAAGPRVELVFTGGCHRLPPAVHAFLDGVEGLVDRGGIKTVYEDYYEETYETCTEAKFSWVRPDVSDAPVTFVITHQATEWTMTVDRAAMPRTFVGVAPGQTLHAGDPVALQLTPASGVMSEVRVTLKGATTTQTFTDGAGLTRVGTELHFTVPAVTESTEVELLAGAKLDLPILECAGPVGCSAQQTAGATIPVTFAP